MKLGLLTAAFKDQSLEEVAVAFVEGLQPPSAWGTFRRFSWRVRSDRTVAFSEQERPGRYRGR